MSLQHNRQSPDQLNNVSFESIELSPDKGGDVVTVGSRVHRGGWEISRILIAQRAGVPDEK